MLLLTLIRERNWTSIFFLFAGFFGLWVAMTWVTYHIDYFASFVSSRETPTSHFLHYLLPLFASLVLFGGIFLTQRFRIGKACITLTYSWLYVAISLLLYILFIFFWVGYVRITTQFNSAMLDVAFITQHFASIITHVSFMYLWLGGIALSTYYPGSFLLKKLNLQQELPPVVHRILSCVLGMFLLVMVGFFAFGLGFASPLFFGVLLIIILILFRKKLYKDTYSFAEKRKISLHFCETRTWLYLTLFFLIAVNFIDAMESEPSGYDSSTFYLNRAHLLAEHNSLIPGGLPYPFEILSGIGYLFNSSATFASILNLFFAILAFLVVYSLTHLLTKKKIAAFIAAMCFLVIPFTQNFIFHDPKPDIFAFLSLSLTFYLLTLWIHNKEKSRILFLAAFFAGLAFSIKATLLLGVIAIIVPLSVIFIIWRHAPLHKVKVFFISFICFMLPLSIWILFAQFNPIPQENDSPFHHRIFVSYNVATAPPSEPIYTDLGVGYDSCSFTQYREDFDRYEINQRPAPWSALFAPWSLTMNENRGIMAYPMNISFVFLALMPFWLLKKILLDKNASYTPTAKNTISLFFISSGIIHWVLWYFLSEGIVWYGYAGFLHLCLIVGIVFTIPFRSKFIHAIVLVIFWCSIFSMLTMRLYNFATPNVFFTIVGGINTFETHYGEVTEILNRDENSKKKMLMTASQSIYHVDNNHKRVVQDRYLDVFNCLNVETDASLTLARLHELDIHYVIFTKGIENIEGEKYGTLHQKADNFRSFANEKLENIYDGNELILYELPQK